MSNQPNDVDDAKQWPFRLEELFIRLLVDEVSKDKLGSGLIKPTTWGQIDNAIHTQSGQHYTVPKLKQKYQRLRTKHREFSKLLEHTGFGWNPDSNTVTTEEDTWQNYLKAHPKAKMFKKKGCEHYSLLGLIFNKSTATGKLARASTQGPLTSTEERDVEKQSLGDGVHVSRGEAVGDDPVLVSDSPNDGQSCRPMDVSEGSRQKKGKSSKMDIALDAWIAAAVARAKKYKRQAKDTEVKSSASDPYSSVECVNVLESMEGIESEPFLFALEKFKDPEWRTMFIAMSDRVVEFFVLSAFYLG